MKGAGLVVGNWKENPATLDDAIDLFEEVKAAVTRIRGAEVVVAPPLAFIGTLSSSYRGKRIAFAAQNVSHEASGPFTGEVSASMLRSLDVEYVIVGHSERRALGETNELIGKKLVSSFAAGLKPILCVGELERDSSGQYLSFVREQIVEGLRRVVPTDLSNLVIAYEPVYAIGKSASEAAKPRDVHEMVIFIRKILTELYDARAATRVRIIYGAAVEPVNAGALIEESGIDGLLPGRASLNADSFAAIIKAVSEA